MFDMVLETPSVSMAARLLRRSLIPFRRESAEYNTRKGNKAGGLHTAVSSSRRPPGVIRDLPRVILPLPAPRVGRQRVSARSLCAGALILLCTLATPATAAKYPGRCTSYDEFTRAIQNEGEELAGRGLGPGQKIVVELHVSKSGTFTLIAVTPSGRTCAFAIGTEWTVYEIEPPEPGGPA